MLAGMQGCDAVIHLASLSSWNDIYSPIMNDVVVVGSQNVLEAAVESGNLRTVFVSSVAAVNGTKEPEVQNEQSPCTLDLDKYIYAKAKLAVENLCISKFKSGLPVVIVNPGEVYGPHDTSLNTAGNLVDFAKSSPVLTCKGGTSVVHVDDVADGIVAALLRGRAGERYILGGDNLSVNELAKLTLDILGQPNKKVMQIPNWILLSAGAVADKLRIPFPINPKVIPYATLFWLMDNQKAKSELGVTFRNARATLEPTLKWLQDENLC
jgi:dihydroflavonol-4-reductase